MRGHHYCSYKKHHNNGTYEDIARTDEVTRSVVTSVHYRPSAALITCHNGFPGLLCGRQCKVSWDWCRSDEKQETCDVGGSLLQSDDALLCTDNVFWKNEDCNWYDHNWNGVLYYGFRCQGSVQACVRPWYYNYDGDTYETQTCSDNSDQVMFQLSSCLDPAVYLQLHNDVFTPDDHLDESWLADRTNKSGYYSSFRQRHVEYDARYSDLHSCQASCSHLATGCTSCSHPDYFQCPLSGLCLHSDLRCDGHPKCPFSEDESVEICFERWVGAKLVSPFGSLKCSSARHPGMNILSTPCDGIVECADGKDEAFCKDSAIVNYLLYGSCAVIIIVYVGLKILTRSEESTNNSQRKVTDKDYENRLKIIQMNTLKLHLINAEDMESKKQKCLIFYNTLAKIHHNDESAIFICMHKLRDPAITQVVHDSKFPGFKQKTIDKIQETFKTNCITSFQNFVIRHEILGQTIGLIRSVVKILGSYIDFFKDTFLAFTLLNAVGGPASVLGHPTQFTSAIVMVMGASIIYPLVACTLHLVLDNPFLLFNFDVSRSIAVILCFMFWILNPVLLRYCYESAKEKSRKMIKKDSQNVSTLLFRMEEKVIKTCLVQFHKIELGKTVRPGIY